MPAAIEGIPWEDVRNWYVTEGVTARDIVSRLVSRGVFGMTEASIRQRAKRHKWIALSIGEVGIKMAEKTAHTIAKRIAKQEVENYSGRIKSKAREAVEECERESLAMAKAFVSRATEEAGRAEVKELSSVAAIGRSGVDTWRTNLGLNATGSSSMPSAVAVTFILKGASSGVTERDTVTPRDMTPCHEPPIDI